MAKAATCDRLQRVSHFFSSISLMFEGAFFKNEHPRLRCMGREGSILFTIFLELS